MFQKFVPPIPGRQTQNIFQTKINMDLCLQVIKALGINLVNIGASDILSGNKVLIMGLLWQVIHLGLNNKIKQQQTKVTVDGKELNMVKYSDKEFEQLVLMWVKEQTGVDVKNFGKDFQSGEVLLKLLTKVCKDQLIELDDEQNQEEGQLEQSQTLNIQDCTSMIKKLGINIPFRTEDIKSGNEKIMFTLLAEIFSSCLNKELGVGNDNTTQMQKLNVVQVLADKGFIYCSYLDFFEFIPQYDKYRANAQIDFNELTIFMTEFMKDANEQEKLGFLDQQYDEITYQILLSEQMTSQQIMDLHLKAVQLSRDFLDKIFDKAQKEQTKELLEKYLQPVLKYLITLATDDIYQAQIVQYDFHYCLTKFLKLQLNHIQQILLAFYFAIMSKLTFNNKFALSSQQILKQLAPQVDEIKILYLRAILPCIASMVFEKSSMTQEINNKEVMFIDKMTRQIWQQKDTIIAQTCLNMLYSQYYKLTIQKAAAQNYCQASINYITSLKNQQIQAIVTLDTYRFFGKIICQHPNDIAKLIIKHCQVETIIRYIMEFDIDELTDNYSQIQLSSKCLLLQVLRKFTMNKDADKLISKQIQQLLVLPGIANPGQITYKDITENNLANELLRSAARQATYALVPYDIQIVEMTTEILDQVAKSSSVVAFRETLKDIILINSEAKKHQKNFLILFDLIFACLKKYEGNIVLMQDLLLLGKEFADDKYFVQSGVFDQIDALCFNYFKLRRIAVEYLQVVEELGKQRFDIFNLTFNSLNKIYQAQNDDISVMSVFYEVLYYLDDDRYIQGRFIDDLVQVLGKYSEQPQFVYIIFKCLLQKIKFNANVAIQCQRKNIYKLVINYTKYIKQTFRGDEYTQQICDTAVDIILTGINMISDFNTDESLADIEKILIM